MKDRIRKIIESLKEVEGTIDRLKPSEDNDDEIPPDRPLISIKGQTWIPVWYDLPRPLRKRLRSK